MSYLVPLSLRSVGVWTLKCPPAMGQIDNLSCLAKIALAKGFGKKCSFNGQRKMEHLEVLHDLVKLKRQKCSRKRIGRTKRCQGG